jgi:hypothetical protein
MTGTTKKFRIDQIVLISIALITIIAFLVQWLEELFSQGPNDDFQFFGTLVFSFLFYTVFSITQFILIGHSAKSSLIFLMTLGKIIFVTFPLVFYSYFNMRFGTGNVAKDLSSSLLLIVDIGCGISYLYETLFFVFSLIKRSAINKSPEIEKI